VAFRGGVGADEGVVASKADCRALAGGEASLKVRCP
jgi:hypothetical protein